MKDNFPSTNSQDSAVDAFAITPDDDADLAQRPRAIYVGGAGNVVATFPGGDVTFTGVPVGTILAIRPSRIKESSTATNMVALV